MVDRVTADLATDDGLTSAVLISIFSDRRANADDLPPGETDRRGWWGDVLTNNDPIGSGLWLLQREKRSTEILVRAESYCRESLQWALDDGIATAVAAVAEWTESGWLSICVTLTLPDQSNREFQFSVNGNG